MSTILCGHKESLSGNQEQESEEEGKDGEMTYSYRDANWAKDA